MYTEFRLRFKIHSWLVFFYTGYVHDYDKITRYKILTRSYTFLQITEFRIHQTFWKLTILENILDKKKKKNRDHVFQPNFSSQIWHANTFSIFRLVKTAGHHLSQTWHFSWSNNWAHCWVWQPPKMKCSKIHIPKSMPSLFLFTF